MSNFRVRAAQSVIVAAILVIAGSQSAYSQSTQHRQTDLQFVTRMNQEAAQMLTSANNREKRMRKLDAKLRRVQTEIVALN